MLDLELRDGEVVDPQGRATYLSTVDNLWPGMDDIPGFRELLAADRIARGPWASGGTTRFGGVLAMPIGKRRIDVLPPAPTERQIDALRQEGVRWVLWVAADPDSIPQVIRSGACASVYGRGSTRYYAFDLAGCDTTVAGGEP